MNEDASVYGRMCAARFLLELDDPDARQLVETYLDSSNPRHRFNMARALMAYVGRDPKRTWGVEKMIEAIQDDRLVATVTSSTAIEGNFNDFPEGDWGDVMEGPLEDACWALGWLKATEAVPALISVLEKNPKNTGAAFALGEIGDERGIPCLFKVLKENTGYDGREITALGKFKYKPAVPILTERLRKAPAHDPNALHDVSEIIEALQMIGDKSAVPALREYAARPVSDYKIKAQIALACLEHEDPLPVLVSLLSKDNHPSEQLDVLYNIIRMKDPRSTDSLFREAKLSPYFIVREVAISGLVQLGSDDAHKRLVDLLNADFSGLDYTWGCKFPPDDGADYLRRQIETALEE